MSIPFTRPPEWSPIRPGRFAATIETKSIEGCRLALLGLPDDTGVRLNGGRPGAAEGPRAFRAALASFGTTFDLFRREPLDVRVFDAGDIEPVAGNDEHALNQTHVRVGMAVTALREAGCDTICIGGGHDLTLPSVTAVARWRGRPLGGINLDAHLDVRERVGSGMPFRRLIEEGHLDPKAFVELGLGRFANDQSDVDWLRALGGKLILADTVLEDDFEPVALLDKALGVKSGFVSIDLDGIDSSHAPGVSALNAVGLSVRHAADLAEAAGLDQRVLHFDIMELCPPHDHEGRTARVAALLFLSFVAGYRKRPA